MKSKEDFMRVALELAGEAWSMGEVPVGCVVVRDGIILGKGKNEKENRNDATAHAEILALREAGRAISNWRLDGATVYVTKEPCPMCLYAMVEARVDSLIFGCYETRQNRTMNRKDEGLWRFLPLRVEGGILEIESQRLLKGFFKGRRRERRDGRVVEGD